MCNLEEESGLVLDVLFACHGPWPSDSEKAGRHGAKVLGTVERRLEACLTKGLC